MRSLASRHGQAVYDGLWQCLCPGFDRWAARQALRGSRAIPSRPQARARYSTLGDLAVLPREDSPGDGDGGEGMSIGPLLKAKLPPTEELQAFPVHLVESALLKIRSPSTQIPLSKDIQVPGNISRSRRIIELVSQLLSRPSYALGPFVYECLADAYASPKGSAAALNKLMFHMARHGVKPTAEFCRLALAVLANHPNYTLREEVMGVMKEYWFDLEGEARQFYLLGLLRDEQYELAYEKLQDDMASPVRRDATEAWVLDTFVFVLGRQGFLDEMCTVFEWRERLRKSEEFLPHEKKKRRATDSARTNALFYLLDTCSSAYHYRGTMLGWEELVATGLVSPPDGLLENVGGTAARHGDARLASEVLEMLASRSRVQAWHYEAVVEAFLRAEDFAGAFRLYEIMSRQGFAVTAAGTHVVYELLTARPHLCEQAEAALQEGEASYPLMAAVARATAEQWGSARAMGLYLDIKTVWGRQLQGDLVLRMLLHSRNGGESPGFEPLDEGVPAKSIVEECLRDYEGVAAKKGIVEERLSREERSQLIVQFARAGALDAAFQLAMHAARTRASSKDGRRGWLGPLLEASVKKEDGRVWGLMDAFADAGDVEGAGAIRDFCRQMDYRSVGKVGLVS